MCDLEYACKNEPSAAISLTNVHHHADQVRVQVGSGEGPGLPPRPALGGGLAAQWRHPAVSILFGGPFGGIEMVFWCALDVVELHVGSGTVSTCGREVGIRDKVRRASMYAWGASGRAESGVGFAAAACVQGK